MFRLFAAACLGWWLVGPALAANLDAAAVNNAEFHASYAQSWQGQQVRVAWMRANDQLGRGLAGSEYQEGRAGRVCCKRARRQAGHAMRCAAPEMPKQD